MDDHLSKDCLKEKRDSGKLKNLIGEYFEEFITQNYKCQRCDSELRRLADFSPSCDVVCKCCGHKYEVKSKCLSVKDLPSNIIIKHGNYEKFNYRLTYEELDMFMIIYSYNRKNKVLSIRKLYYLPNSLIIDENVSSIKKIYKYNSIKTEIEFTNIPEKYNVLKKKIWFKR